MSRARLVSTIPVVGLLAYILYSGKKKAEAIAADNKTGFDLKGNDGLGWGGFKMPSLPSVKAVVSNPVKALTPVARVAVNPVAQLTAARKTFEGNKIARLTYGVASNMANPIKQIKTTKDFVSNARRGNDRISKYALIMSDPIAQQREIKHLTGRQKQQQEAKVAAENNIPPGSLFPYQVEPGIWIDSTGVRVNQDGSKYVDSVTPEIAVDPAISEQPSVSYDTPATGYDPDYDPGYTADPNAPYYVPNMGLWYNPKDDSYYDSRTNQYYDGYLNPISASGVPGQTSVYYGGSATVAPVPGVEYDPYTGYFYDYDTDTYYDPNSGQYFDGYLNPIDSNNGALQGLGALGKFRFHIAPSAYAKAGAIVGAVAAVVGCVYASGGCAAYISADAALAAYAWRKSKPNPADGQSTELASESYRKEQAAKAQYAEAHANEPYYDTQYNMWYSPADNQYYDPATGQYYSPSQPVTRDNVDSNGLEPAVY